MNFNFLTRIQWKFLAMFLLVSASFLTSAFGQSKLLSERLGYRPLMELQRKLRK
jgi:hypothetical protein